MEKKGLTRLHRQPSDFPRSIWIFVLGGVGVGVLSVVLFFPELISPSTGDSRANQDSSDVVSAAPTSISLSSEVVTTIPEPDDPRHAEVGQPAPDFTLKALTGEMVSLSDFRGRPVLINFWATWCGPCRIEMPELVRTYNAHKNEGFIILAVDLTYQDSVDDVRSFVEEFNMDFPVLLDEEGEVSEGMYRLLGLPVSVFVNREGIVTHIQIGAMTDEQIDEYVNEILS